MRYAVIWDNGREVSEDETFDLSFDDAKEEAFEILRGWMNGAEKWSNEEWNEMIEYAHVFVATWNYTKEDYEEEWAPTDEDLERIGWVKREE